MTTLPPRRSYFEGAVSFETGDGWIRPWRLPFEERKLFPSPEESLLMRAQMGAGVRLRLETDAVAVGLRCLPASSEERLFDLTIGGKRVATARLAPGAEEVVFEGLPARRKVVELWLPMGAPVAVKSLRLSSGATARATPDPRPKWVTYGSSITHCRTAHSPSRTWPAAVALAKGWNLTCLGYGGQCHLDPMVARLIRDLPADIISLKLGINVSGGSLSWRTFRPAVIGMVKVIREKHPLTPIAVVSPIISPPREGRKEGGGLALTGMREHLADAVERLRACGDRHIRYFDGLDLFGPDLVKDYLPDALHPNGDGYEIMARNFLRVVTPWLRPRRGA